VSIESVVIRHSVKAVAFPRQTETIQHDVQNFVVDDVDDSYAPRQADEEHGVRVTSHREGGAVRVVVDGPENPICSGAEHVEVELDGVISHRYFFSTCVA
jgi:hypothetical protein